MSGYPIRMAVRVDFSDGSEHEYEVRGPDTVDAPLGAVFWPAAVVSAAMREQITLEQACTQALAAATAKLAALREWAEHPRDPAVTGVLMGVQYMFAVNDVLRILDAS